MSKLYPFYTDKKTSDAILGAAKAYKSQAIDELASGNGAADVNTQFQNTCQFKLTSDWQAAEGSEHNYIAGGTKFVPVAKGAEVRSYPTIIYAYGEKPTTEKEDIVFATRRGNRWCLIQTGGAATPTPTESFATIILPVCRSINPHAQGDWNIPFGNVFQTQYNSRSHFDAVPLLPNGNAAWTFIDIAAFPELTTVTPAGECYNTDHVSRPVLSDDVFIQNTACNTRAYGLWYKTDKDGLRYPILCSVESLTFGTGIETRRSYCNSDCDTSWTVFEFEIIRQGNRLKLPTVYCSVSCPIDAL